MAGKSNCIFVAYVSADRERVRPVVAQLEACGIRVLWDQTPMVPGKPWPQQIDENIRAAGHFLWMMSENSVDSEEVFKEFGTAKGHAQIQVVCLDEQRPARVKAEISVLQWVFANALGPLFLEFWPKPPKAGRWATVLASVAAGLATWSMLSVSQPPIGSVVAWPVVAAPPAGWMICKGDELSTADYPEIAALLATTYGAIGPGKVKLPDFRGYFLRGHGDTTTAIGHRRPGAFMKTSADWPAYRGDSWKRINTVYNGKDSPLTWSAVALKSQSGANVTSDYSHVLGFPLPKSEGMLAPSHYPVHWIIRVK